MVIYEIEYENDGDGREVDTRRQVIDAPQYRVTREGQVRFDKRMLSWVFENGAGWDRVTIGTYRPLTIKRGEIVAGAMWSELASYNLAGHRATLAKLQAEVAGR